MMIQTVLFLKLDIDDPPAFPRHAEMAVKWKHLSSVFGAALFMYSLSIRVKKKKKIYDSLFFKDAASSAVFQFVFR